MDLREELLEAITDLELDGWKVISIEAVHDIVKRCDEERLRLNQAVAAAVFGGDR